VLIVRAAPVAWRELHQERADDQSGHVWGN
jgi:hypothetical protein